MPSLFNAVAMRSEGLDDSLLMAIARVLSLSPFGWALAAPGYLAQGRAGAALSLAVGALALPIALAPLWGGVVRRVMSGDRASGRRRRCEGDADVPAPADAVRTVQPTLSGATTSAPLVWQRRLERVIPPPAAAIAARCLRYWRTDPRYLALGASAVFVALAVAGIKRGDFHGNTHVFNFTGIAVINIRTAHFLEKAGDMAEAQMRHVNLHKEMGRVDVVFDRGGNGSTRNERSGKQGSTDIHG